MRAWASFAVDAPVPVVDAVRSQAVVVVDGVADRERRYPVFGAGPISSETLVCAPMLVHGTEVIGCLTIGFAERRPLTEIDRAFIQAVAELCGQAVHRARLCEYQQRALARQRFLAEATALLAEDLDHERTMGLVAGLAVAHVAEVCVVCVQDEDGMRTAAAAHRDPAGQAVVDQLVARQPVIRNPQLLDIARRGVAVHMPVIEPAAQDLTPRTRTTSR